MPATPPLLALHTRCGNPQAESKKRVRMDTSPDSPHRRRHLIRSSLSSVGEGGFESKWKIVSPCICTKTPASALQSLHDPHQRRCRIVAHFSRLRCLAWHSRASGSSWKSPLASQVETLNPRLFRTNSSDMMKRRVMDRWGGLEDFSLLMCSSCPPGASGVLRRHRGLLVAGGPSRNGDEEA